MNYKEAYRKLRRAKIDALANSANICEVKKMEWKDLSDEAKSVIEWVEDPFTNKRETIEIKIGDTFYRKCPKRCVDFGESLGDTSILITTELYQEILRYVTESEDIHFNQYTDELVFRLKDGVTI